MTTRSVTRFGLGFSLDLKRRRRMSWRVRGWGIVSSLFGLYSQTLSADDLSTRTLFSFLLFNPSSSSVVNAFFSVYPPCNSLHSFRANRPCFSPVRCPVNYQCTAAHGSRFSLVPNRFSLFFFLISLPCFHTSIFHASPFSKTRDLSIFIVHCPVSAICASP